MLYEKYNLQSFRSELEDKITLLSKDEAWDVYVNEFSKYLIDRGYNFLGQGRHRKAYLSKDGKSVVKVPTEESGSNANYGEYRTYMRSIEKDTDTLDIYPRVKLIEVIHHVVIMEKLDTNVDIKDMPWWAGYIDCNQIGYDSKGNLKAYDYGVY